ncbi:MAG: glycosyltransferase [Syntrophaceae bacterium]|nr:glycosyltransferase [Syntrophaceae bacterium]
MTERECIVLFARYPEKGKVKSRLAATYGAEFVLQLYDNFVADSLDRLKDTEVPFIIAFDPPEKEDEMRSHFGRDHVYMPQEGSDLGERMYYAFRRCFAEGFDSAVLIGSDIPDLPREILEEALFSLENHDAVIGPSRDGGYYLIGFKKDTLTPQVFKNIPWGAPTVLAATMGVFTTRENDVHLLPEWNDMDTPDDLADLVRRNSDTPFAGSRTMSYVKARILDKG